MTSETVPWILSDAVGAYSGKISCCAPMFRCRWGLLRQNPYLRPDIPLLTGLITAKFLSAPRYSSIDGAYYGKIPFCAPIFQYRRGLLRQNPYLCPDIPVSTGLITAKFLSAPRYPGIDGAYYGKIPYLCPDVQRWRV